MKAEELAGLLLRKMKHGKVTHLSAADLEEIVRAQDQVTTMSVETYAVLIVLGGVVEKLK